MQMITQTVYRKDRSTEHCHDIKKEVSNNQDKSKPDAKAVRAIQKVLLAALAIQKRGVPDQPPPQVLQRCGMKP
jgi:hypothetical protein